MNTPSGFHFKIKHSYQFTRYRLCICISVCVCICTCVCVCICIGACACELCLRSNSQVGVGVLVGGAEVRGEGGVVPELDAALRAVQRVRGVHFRRALLHLLTRPTVNK